MYSVLRAGPVVVEVLDPFFINTILLAVYSF